MSWSATDANLVYGISGYLSNVKIRAYNVATKQYVWEHDFAAAGELSGGIPFQMSKARSNDRYFSFHWKPSEAAAIKYAVVYDKDLNKTYLFDVTNATYGVPGFDECRLDRDGKYLTLATGKEVYIWQFATQSPSQRVTVKYDGTERAGGHADFADGLMVQADTWGTNGNRLIKRPLNAPGTWQQIFDSGISDWNTDQHISMCGPNDTWALVSTKTLPADYNKPFSNEIFLVKMDGSGAVQRLAHHRSSLSEYWTTPRANVSPDGRFFAYNSDWNGGHNDVYVGVLPTGLWGTAATTPGTPTATASATPTSGTAPLNVNFSGSGSSPNGLITSYKWNFGDGTSATTPSAAHTYNTAGTYAATLTVTDSANQTATKSITITVTQPAATGTPTARVSASTTSGTAPVDVILDGSGSTSPNGAISNYAWDFGDGTTGVGTRLTHSYRSAGSFTARLTVTDVAGKTASASIVINVAAATGGGTTSSATVKFVNGAANSTTYDVSVLSGYPNYTIDTGMDSRVGGSSGAAALIAMPGIIGTSAGQIPPGATITSATLTLTVSQAQAISINVARILDPSNLGMWYTGTSPSNDNVGVAYGYRDARSGVAKKWSNTATNVRQVLAAADSALPLDGSQVRGAKINLNVTTSVAAWAAGAANQGWAITTDNATDAPFQFFDSQYGAGYAPELTVAYTTASGGGSTPTTPTNVTLTLRNGDGQAGSTSYDETILRTYPTYTMNSTSLLRIGGSYGYSALIAYPQLIGSAAGQIPAGAKIVSATLTFKVNASANATINLSRILDSQGLGMWYTGSHASGYNVGASYSRRNGRTGTRWSTTANNIAQSSQLLGSKMMSVGATSLAFDVTSSVAAWAAGAANQGWWLSTSNTTAVTFNDSTRADVNQRPVLTVVYSR